MMRYSVHSEIPSEPASTSQAKVVTKIMMVPKRNPRRDSERLVVRPSIVYSTVATAILIKVSGLPNQ